MIHWFIHNTPRFATVFTHARAWDPPLEVVYWQQNNNQTHTSKRQQQRRTRSPAVAGDTTQRSHASKGPSHSGTSSDTHGDNCPTPPQRAATTPGMPDRGTPESNSRADGAHYRHPSEERAPTKRQPNRNDPSAGSPTETLLRLLLPLTNSVRATSRSARADVATRFWPQSEALQNQSIGSSDGRCTKGRDVISAS